MIDTSQYNMSWPDLGILPTPPNSEVISDVPDFGTLQPSNVQDLLTGQGESPVTPIAKIPLDIPER